MGDHTVNPACQEVIYHGRVYKLDEQVMKVLLYLIEHRNRIVTRDELFKELWPMVFVSQDSLNRCISILRKVLRDEGGSDKKIKTIRGKGYRYVGKVHFLVNTTSRDTPNTLVWKVARSSVHILTVIGALVVAFVGYCMILGLGL